MPTDKFSFQKFEVWHNRCAMKVGTDGVLLGAWTDVYGVDSALDVGVGSGLISLMLAQRNTSLKILGIDIDEGAVEQADFNFRHSPFAERLKAVRSDFCDASERYSLEHPCLIVSNPPFFTEDTLSNNAARARARSSQSLPFETLIANVAHMFTDSDRFALILPYGEAANFILMAASEGLYLRRRCDVQTTETKPFRRSMLEFSMQQSTTEFSSLCLQNPDGSRSEAYQELTRDFYL